MISISGVVQLPYLVARELVAGGGRQRVPEPMVMDEAASVEQFDASGQAGGGLLGVYEVVSRATSHIAPAGATVFDLGCGPARYLSYLARRRPDLRIHGIDLSPNMLAQGERTLREEGVADRVSLHEGDMTDFADVLPPETGVLSCVWALHHLPSRDHLVRCFEQIAVARERTGCAVIVFDFARLKRDQTHEAFLKAAAPSMTTDPVMRHDSLASEAAGWSYGEMREALQDAGLGKLHHCLTRPYRGFQLHWAPAVDGERVDDSDLWHRLPMPLAVRADAVPLRAVFLGLP